MGTPSHNNALRRERTVVDIHTTRGLGAEFQPLRKCGTPMAVSPLYVGIKIARRPVRCPDSDADRNRTRRARQAEEGPLPPADAIAEVTP